MIDRRRAITLLSTSVLGSTLMGSGAAAFIERSGRNDRGDYDGRGGTDDQLLYNLPLRLRMAQLAIQTIFLLGASQLLMLRTAIGVDQRNQNRANLSGIPLLGSLMQRVYSAGDFTANNRIGAVYAEGTALFIYLYPELLLNPQARQLLFFNLLYSYALRDTYQTGNWQMLAALMPTFCAIETVRRSIQARVDPAQAAAPAQTGATRSALAPHDMDNLAMAGLVSDDSQGKTALPVLGDIPLLKGLFAGDVHKASDDQLLVLMRPSIVVGDSA
jgi:hypothetical protein